MDDDLDDTSYDENNFDHISYDEKEREFWNKESAQLRYGLYSSAIAKAKKAIESEFYIEVIAIYEGILSDRLESRAQFLLKQNDFKIKTIGRAVKICRSNDSELRNPVMFDLYDRITKWAKKRNFLVHHLVKLKKNDKNQKFETRYEIAKSAAYEALEIFRLFKKEIDRQKRIARV